MDIPSRRLNQPVKIKKPKKEKPPRYPYKYKNKMCICESCLEEYFNKDGKSKRCEMCKDLCLRRCSVCSTQFKDFKNNTHCPDCLRKKQMMQSRKRASTLRGYARQLINSKINGIKYIDLTVDEVIEMYDFQEGRCALTNIPMELGDKRNGNSGNPFAMSIDRIDNSIGYTKENVWLIIFCINQFKGVHNLETMDYIVKEYYKNNCFDSVCY